MTISCKTRATSTSNIMYRGWTDGIISTILYNTCIYTRPSMTHFWISTVFMSKTFWGCGNWNISIKMLFDLIFRQYFNSIRNWTSESKRILNYLLHIRLEGLPQNHLGIRNRQCGLASCQWQRIFEHHYKGFWQYMDSDNVDLYMRVGMDNLHPHDTQVQRVVELFHNHTNIWWIIESHKF